MILIGMGANLPYCGCTPEQTLTRALQALTRRGVQVRHVSTLFHSPPKPHSAQPWFANCVASVRTLHSPEKLLQVLHEIEHVFGRVRRKRWSARTLDLDLLAYHDVVVSAPDVAHQLLKRPFVVPHPALTSRSFVVKPLQQIAPGWRHPVSGAGIAEIARQLPPDPLIFAAPPCGPFGARRNAASHSGGNGLQSLAKQPFFP